MLGITHDSLPFTDEEVSSGDAAALATRALASKRLQVRSEIRKREFAAVQQDANSYRRAALYAETLSEYITATGPTYSPTTISLGDAESPYEVVVPLADLHYGKLGRDSYGNTTYNRDVALSSLVSATEEAIRRLTLRGRPKSVSLVMLGDGLHIDNVSRGTTKGTAQITDGDAETLVTRWFDVVRDWTDMWRAVAPVTVFVIGGNHDRLVSAALRAGLRGWFRGAKDVRVEESLDRRQYLQIGNALFMFTHGDVGRPGGWAEMFAREVPGAWGACRWRYICHGHFHSMREHATHAGVETIQCPSLSGVDEWELSQGYPCDPKTLMLIVDRTDGVVAKEIIRPT